MRWSGRFYVWLNSVNNGARSEGVHLIITLLTLPLFKISHLFFKLAYALQERRLRIACSEDFFLKFYDRRIANGSVIDVLYSLRRIVQGFEDAEAAQNIRHDKLLG